MSNSDNVVLLLQRDTGGDRDDAIIIGVNAAFRRASGYPNDWLLGRDVGELFPGADHAAALMQAIRANAALRGELACRRATGDTFMLGMHLMPAPARMQGSQCFLLLGRDITPTLLARQTQDSIQHLLAKVFGSVDAAVAIISGAGRIVMTNPAFDLLLGYAPNGAVGRTSIELVAPDQRELVTTIVDQQKTDGRDRAYNITAVRADGSQLAVHITSVIATTPDAKTFRIITVQPSDRGAGKVLSKNVGRIKLVGLDSVREALKDRWPAAAERAMATAEAVLKRNCGPEDSYSRVDDTSFLVCFGNLTEEESSFRAAMIGREIRKRLIGLGEDPESAYVRSIAAVVRLPDYDGLDAQANAILLDGLDKELERLEREARQTLHDAVTCANCESEPVFGRNGRPVASQIQIPRKLQRQVFTALAALTQKEAAAFDADGLLIRLVAQHAVSTMSQGDVSPLLIDISFDVFGARARTQRFFSSCSQIDPRVTGRLLLLLTSLPPGLPRTRLQDCVNRLRPFCRGVGFHVEAIAELSQIDLANGFNPVVVLPAAACDVASAGDLKGLFSSLQSRRAKVLVSDVGSERHAAVLRSVGADMIAMKHPHT